MDIGNWLVKIGWIVVALGILFGLIFYGTIDKESYTQAKEIYEELDDNEFAKAEFVTEKTMYVAELTNAVIVLVGGIVGGLLIVGFGTLIESVNRMSQTQDQRLIEISRNTKIESI
jgi:type II secretory pathway component PulF